MAKTHHLHSKFFSSVVAFFNHSVPSHSNLQQSNQSRNEGEILIKHLKEKPDQQNLSSEFSKNLTFNSNADLFSEAKLLSDNELIKELNSLNSSLILQNNFLTLQNHHKSEFLASVAHELKNQIGAIISLSEFIKSESCDGVRGKYSESRDGVREEDSESVKREEDSDSVKNSESAKEESIKEYATDIYNVASEMLEFTCDLMDVHQAESGQFSIDLSKEIDIANVIKKSVRINYDFALRRGIQIKVEMAENLELVRLDARRMKQILTNLISNAIKYSPERTEIKISCKENQKLLEITVSDQGFGMSEEEIELALQKHQKIENENSEKFDSFGLGLPMVKSLVELQKGRMEIKSKANEGTEMILRFPYSGHTSTTPQM